MKKIILFLFGVMAVLVTIRGDALALNPLESLVDDHSYHTPWAEWAEPLSKELLAKTMGLGLVG